jgi:hypothetical protein
MEVIPLRYLRGIYLKDLADKADFQVSYLYFLVNYRKETGWAPV